MEHGRTADLGRRAVARDEVGDDEVVDVVAAIDPDGRLIGAGDPRNADDDAEGE